MNSTDRHDDEQLAAQLGALFDELLLPMAQQLRARGAAPFPLAPDVSWLSYYVRRRRSFMTPPDFSSASCADVAELAERLRRHWQGLGRDALAEQAGRFAAVAQVLPAGRVAESELSPYVYAMF